MIELSDYAANVINNINMIGMWIAVVICCRNFTVCLEQYKRSRGKIHLVNIAQVSVFFIHRVLYGIIPLFEIKTCAYFPLLISLWHLTYLLFYIVMFMRLIILEQDRYSRWIKIVGILLITLRFADWPYELAFHSIQEKLRDQAPGSGSQCWAEWGAGVIILNFVGDALANLFLSGMFVRRLFIHINMSKSIISHQNQLIERIARKSLICLALTFVVNLAMNLLKVTTFIGVHSDAFTVYFEIIESTLLVEALKNDGSHKSSPHVIYCEGCQKELSPVTDRSPNNDAHVSSQMLVKTSSNHTDIERQRFNSTYSEDTYRTHPLHTVASVEPAVYSENPFRYSSGPSNSSTLYNRGPSMMIDGPLPSPPNKKEIFAMTPTLEKSLTPRASSSILTTQTNHITRENSPNGSQTWTPNT